jgi:hypothetical protein
MILIFFFFYSILDEKYIFKLIHDFNNLIFPALS